jgi:hypothetical protein
VEKLKDIESSYRRWVDDLWNTDSLEIVDELFAENGIAFYPFFMQGDEPIRGRENFKTFVRLIKSKYCEIVAEVVEITSDGERVTALCRMSGKLKVVKPGQLSGNLSTKGLCRIIFKDGKIIEIWNNMFSEVDEYEKAEYMIQNPQSVTRNL